MAGMLARLCLVGAMSAGVWSAVLLHVPAFAQAPSPAGVVAPGSHRHRVFRLAFRSRRCRRTSIPSTRLTIDLRRPLSSGSSTPATWVARRWRKPYPPPSRLTITADQIGQVFAITLDDAVPPNIYAAATSVYGLSIVVPGPNGLPVRARKGAANAQFMPGLFGPAAARGGPGSIWRIDGRTGAVSLFVNVMFDGVANSGPALGGMAFDRASRQIFVADRDTGMIHRFDLDRPRDRPLRSRRPGAAGDRPSAVAVRPEEAPRYRNPGVRQRERADLGLCAANPARVRPRPQSRAPLLRRRCRQSHLVGGDRRGRYLRGGRARGICRAERTGARH